MKHSKQTVERGIYRSRRCDVHSAACNVMCFPFQVAQGQCREARFRYYNSEDGNEEG